MAVIVLTVEWIQNNIIEDDSGSGLGKAELYEEYSSYVNEYIIGSQPIPQEEFGKILLNVYPHITSRRMGPRENSIPTYIGIRKRWPEDRLQKTRLQRKEA